MKHGKAKKIVLITAAVVFVLLAAGYITGVVYFRSHFMIGTSINGMTGSGLTVTEVKQKLRKHVGTYHLDLQERGGSAEEITAAQLKMAYVDDKGVDHLMKAQNAFTWPYTGSSGRKLTVPADVTYDASKIDGILAALHCFAPGAVTAPADAKVTDNGTAFVITPEVQGNTLKKDETKQAVVQTLDAGGNTLDLETSDLYEKPAILANDANLAASMNQLNTLIQANLTYDIAGSQYAVNRDVVKSWLVSDAAGKITLNEQAAAQFVAQMAYDTDTFGLAHTFKTSLGSVVTLNAGGDYGWAMDEDATTKDLLAALYAGKNEALTPQYEYSAMDRGANDIGGTYVEICIKQQKMWCYKDGKLVVTTPVVTGNSAQGLDTPSGCVWAIDAKRSPAHFNATNSDVTYWLPFNGDVGVHDASWRTPAMFADPKTYLANGSHGCINTPLDAAKKIYDTVDVGYPVIVYYSPDQVAGKQPTQENKAG